MSSAGFLKDEGHTLVSNGAYLKSFWQSDDSSSLGSACEKFFDGERSSPQQKTGPLVSESASSTAVPLTVPFRFASIPSIAVALKKSSPIPSPYNNGSIGCASNSDKNKAASDGNAMTIFENCSAAKEICFFAQ